MGFDLGRGLAAVGTMGLSEGGFMNAGGIFGGDDDKAKAMKRLLEQMQRAQATQYVKSEGYGIQGLHDLLGGYDSAIQNVARTGAASKNAAIGAGRRAGAAGQQSLAGRGLYNTSALNAAQAMNTGATSQALANIDQAVANAKGGLQAARGQASQQGYRYLGDLSQSYAMQQMKPLEHAYQAAASAPSQFDQLMQLLQAGGQIGGMFMGVPSFGGGGGRGGGGGGYYDHDSEMG